MKIKNELLTLVQEFSKKDVLALVVENITLEEENNQLNAQLAIEVKANKKLAKEVVQSQNDETPKEEPKRSSRRNKKVADEEEADMPVTPGPEVNNDQEDNDSDLSGMTRTELKLLGQSLGIKGAHVMKKDILIEAILEVQEGSDPIEDEPVEDEEETPKARPSRRSRNKDADAEEEPVEEDEAPRRRPSRRAS